MQSVSALPLTWCRNSLAGGACCQWPCLPSLLSILQKLFRLRSFKREVLAPCINWSCPNIPLPRPQRRLALCSQSFVGTLLAQIDRVGLLTIIDNYRTELPESEGFATAAIVAPKQKCSWNADALGTKLISSASSQLRFNDSHMILSPFRFHPKNFSFRTLNLRTLFPRYPLFHSCLISSFLPCHVGLYMSVAAFTFRIQGDAFHLSRPMASRFSHFTLQLQTPHLFFFQFLSQLSTKLQTWSHPCLSSSSEDSELTCCMSHTMEDLHDSK